MSPRVVSPFVRCWSLAPCGIDRKTGELIDSMMTQSLWSVSVASPLMSPMFHECWHGTNPSNCFHVSLTLELPCRNTVSFRAHIFFSNLHYSRSAASPSCQFSGNFPDQARTAVSPIKKTLCPKAVSQLPNTQRLKSTTSTGQNRLWLRSAAAFRRIVLRRYLTLLVARLRVNHNVGPLSLRVTHRDLSDGSGLPEEFA